MEALLIYLLKSAALLTMFVALFVALMQQETFHKLNRFTLLAIIVLSISLPFVNIGIETPFTRLFAEESVVNTTTIVDFKETVSSDLVQVTPVTVESTIEWTDIIFTIYIIGAMLLLTRLIFMYAGLAKIIKRAVPTDTLQYSDENIRLRVTDDPNIKPFSWFRWVVINSEDLRESGREIITHETVHARSFHSLDIIFIDLLILLQWFNPMAWFTKYCIKNIHEYEADEAVINSGADIGKYQQMIIKKAVGARLYSIANSFNHSSTIKRITMMCKKKSNLWRCTKALYLLPAATIATLLFSQPESVNAIEQPSDGKVNEFVANNQKRMPTIAPGDSTAKKREVIAVGEVKAKIPADTTLIYQVVEQMPQFPNGNGALMTFLQNNIKYPQEARDANTQGKSFVTFVVDKKGEINNARIMKSSGNEALDKEAVRVVESMPAWTPGKQGGKNVAVQYTLPIMFKLAQGNIAEYHQKQTAQQGINKNSPLLIINGAIYDGDASIISNIKEEDIENINVLQEESATKTYGEKGKYGAILIELKKHTQPHPDGPIIIGKRDTGVKEYQFNVGISQEKAIEASNHTPAEFTGDTRDLQLGNSKAVLESNLTEGSVTLEFNVETDGSITFAKVKKSSGNNFIDSEALLLIYRTQKQWKPATKDGNPVRSRPTLTLTFSKHK